MIESSVKVTVWVKVEMTGVASFVICDLHLSVVIHPQFAHNDIVHSRGDFAPSIMIARVGELQVGNVDWIHRKVLATKFTCHSKFPPAHPITTFAVLGEHWRMMADLLGGCCYCNYVIRDML